MKKTVNVIIFSTFIFTNIHTLNAYNFEYKNNDAATAIKNITPKPEKKKIGRIVEGKASYYADIFDGRLTANGEIFSQMEMTAAHRSLPFGTMVRVTNLANQKSVVVRINDRGPYVDGRIIDLSSEAAEQLDMLTKGVTDIKMEILK